MKKTRNHTGTCGELVAKGFATTGAAPTGAGLAAKKKN